jgi:ABC-type enterochelin transport system substrate-binding protein
MIYLDPATWYLANASLGTLTAMVGEVATSLN